MCVHHYKANLVLPAGELDVQRPDRSLNVAGYQAQYCKEVLQRALTAWVSCLLPADSLRIYML